MRKLSMVVLLCSLVACQHLLPTIEVRTIEGDKETITTRTDLEVITLYVQLAQLAAESPIAQRLMEQLLAELEEEDKPEGPSKEERLLQMMQEVRAWLEVYNANRLPR